MFYIGCIGDLVKVSYEPVVYPKYSNNEKQRVRDERYSKNFFTFLEKHNGLFQRSVRL